MENNNQQNLNPQVPHEPGAVFSPQTQPLSATNTIPITPTTPLVVSQAIQEQQPAQPLVVPAAPNQVYSGSGSALAAPQSNHKKKALIFIVLAAFIIGGAALAYVSLNKTSSVALNCMPVAASSIDKNAAISTYTNFAQAAKQSNQTCADSLSSGDFKLLHAQGYPSSKGQWIASRQGGLPSLADRLAKLPKDLKSSSFSQADYTSSLLGGSNDTTPVQGITLTYPLNGANNIEYHLNISFILQKGKVVVDDLVLAPSSLDPQVSSQAGQNEPLSPSDSKTLAAANVRSISTYLGSYFSDSNYYPSDINAANFSALSSNVNQSAFTAPTGTKYVYTASPSGCTTASKNCKNFTLTAIDTKDGSTIKSERSQN